MDIVSRKNNFESIVLKELTIEKENHNPDYLASKSNKYIWVACRYCGKENRVKKSKYTMAGNSNAHMECRKLELKEVDSNWKSDKTKESIKKTLIERHGVEHSSHIPGVIEKRKQTSIVNYGVDNPSKANSIKEKKKETSIKNWGTNHPLQNKEVLKKQAATVRERYGVNHQIELPYVKKAWMDGFAKYVENNNSGKYQVINLLRQPNHALWDDLKTLSLNALADKYEISYGTLKTALRQPEFAQRYYSTYSRPKNYTENRLFELVKSMTDHEVIQNTRQVIKPLELDIYIPELKFAIEFNGDYYHSSINDPDEDENIAKLKRAKTRTQHWIKTKLCRAQGIRLFHIFETDWNNREVQITNFLRTMIGANKTNIAARKCVLNNDPCPQFIEDNHMQGCVKDTQIKYFNLIHDGEIVASMTASRHHRDHHADNKSVILRRLCFKDGYNVQGGASKLFKAFKTWAKEQGYVNIISWSNTCWTEGKIYDILGFDMEEEFKPSYWYVDFVDRRYYSKQSQRKKAQKCPEGYTEEQWCRERGLYQIWDCGKKRWVYTL